MAKTVKAVTSQNSVSDARKILEKLSKSLPVKQKMVDDAVEYISTGIYVLNAALSGTVYGGIVSGKVSVFAGEESTGKTFLALNICREAQKMGKHIVYIDTEGNLRLDSMKKYGIDVSADRLSLYQINKVEDLTLQINIMLEGFKEDASLAKGKYLFVIDSVGQMASKKEKDDLAKGELKTDMTKAKALSTLFRTTTAEFNELGIPVIVCNQTYQTLDMFPKQIMKGGNQLYYSASVIAFLTKAKLKEDDLDSISEELTIGQTGIIVSAKCVKNRIAKPKKIKFELSFEKGANAYMGLDVFCIPSMFSRIGIAKGKMQVDTSTGEMQFIEGGNRWYVNHLNKHVAYKDLFTSTVFTKEVLDQIDLIVKKLFLYKTHEEHQDDWAVAESELIGKGTSVIDGIDLDTDDVDILFED